MPDTSKLEKLNRELEKSEKKLRKRKAEKREFTARKKAGLLTPEEQEAEEKRLAHNREWQKEWREKRKASEPEKPPKQKSIKELMAVEKTGADLTPEDTERLAAYRRKKADQQRARREGKKSDQTKRKVSSRGQPHAGRNKRSIVEMCITGYGIMDNSVHSIWKS